ncbi:hypothetical protein PbJCM13498_40550 [Prolixibacter bellariivorans]|uniref:Pepco domain-containing protein n=1 Tax=Prolixibacter bellariivorans TaxID=314319 RepID=A0A5M4B4V8_9BACT|nr:hypothetical protein [Prolixibacter bellariivorans]GET35192.1 hypothetical protein PbJCM13498_40550 [Prolixibacter bellariivorans]
MSKKVTLFTEKYDTKRGDNKSLFSKRVPTTIELEELQKNIIEFNENISIIIESLKSDESTDFLLDEITINAEIGLSGSVGFMGTGVSGAAKAGISFTLKKK